jgi:ParB family chromosome partitioning protein
MKLPTTRPAPQPIKLADIQIGARLRPVSNSGVQAIIESINETGVMKDAIHVRRRKDGVLVLIAGAHRTEAALRLGWEEIDACVWRDVSDDWVKLMEIDDNLAGAEMTVLDTAVFLARRKTIYERLHPQSKAGVFKGNQHTSNVVAEIISATSFAMSTAEKFGLSDRHVRNLVAAGEALTDAQAGQLRRAPRPVGTLDLMELAKIGDEAERAQVVLKVATGQAKKVKIARHQYAAETGKAEASPEARRDSDYDRLVEAWRRASPASQGKFLTLIGAVVLEGGDGDDA